LFGTPDLRSAELLFNNKNVYSMQVQPTISGNKSNYFYNGYENLQYKISASFKSIRQNETAQKTALAVKEYAPYVISAVGSYLAPVAVTAV